MLIKVDPKREPDHLPSELRAKGIPGVDTVLCKPHPGGPTFVRSRGSPCLPNVCPDCLRKMAALAEYVNKNNVPNGNLPEGMDRTTRGVS